MQEDIVKQETSNAVLKIAIESQTKIMDERFGNIKETLADMKLLMQGFVNRTELEEVKKDFVNQITEIKRGFLQHSEDDKESFGGIIKKLDFVTRMVLIGMGGLGVIEFGLQIWSNVQK